MKRFLLLSLIILLFLVGCDELRSDLYMKGDVFETKEETPAEVTTEPEPKEPVVQEKIEITISAIGDVLSHGYNIKSAKTEDGYDYMPHFESMKGIFDEDDYTIANLESMNAGKQYGYTGYPSFNAPENLSKTLKLLGVDAVSTANNHAMDKGKKAVPDNLENVRNNGLVAFGTAASQEERDTPTVVDVKGIKVGLLSYTYGTNGIPVPEPHLVNLIDKDLIEKDIKAAREAGAEIISVSMHWGNEYQNLPTDEQKDLAKFLEEQGVDILLGCHPHVLQPIELREIEFEGTKKNMAIIYSMGNFYSGQTQDRTRTGIVFRVNIVKENGVASVKDTDYLLTFCNSYVKKNGLTMYQVLPLTDPSAYKDLNRYKEIEKEFSRANELLKTEIEY